MATQKPSILFILTDDQNWHIESIGTLWNAQNVDNYNAPYAGSFNGLDFILDPYTYKYYRTLMSRNRASPISYGGQYSPNVTVAKAYGYLEEATQHPDPWFMNYKIPGIRNFNPEQPVGVGRPGDLSYVNETAVEYNDEYQRARLRVFQSVDEMVEQIVKTLDAKGLLENSYIFYTTNNGRHMSSRRMLPGKECSYKEDIHIPLIVRGPGVPREHITHDIVTTRTDLALTIPQLAGGALQEDFDGTPIPLTDDSLQTGSHAEQVAVEYWGMAIAEGKYGRELVYGHGRVGEIGSENAARKNTYKSLRIQSDEYGLF
ncbi:hypothetical protein SEUCBS139899_009258 [Sporothrix eucalyptigena]